MSTNYQLEQSEAYGLEPHGGEESLEAGAQPILAVHEINMELAAKRFSIAQPQTCACSYRGISFAEIAHQHIAEPRATSRSALLTMNISTKADATASLGLLLNCGDDALLCERVIAKLALYLSVM